MSSNSTVNLSTLKPDEREFLLGYMALSPEKRLRFALKLTLWIVKERNYHDKGLALLREGEQEVQ
jgi:hypothetical protein